MYLIIFIILNILWLVCYSIGRKKLYRLEKSHGCDYTNATDIAPISYCRIGIYVCGTCTYITSPNLPFWYTETMGHYGDLLSNIRFNYLFYGGQK